MAKDLGGIVRKSAYHLKRGIAGTLAASTLFTSLYGCAGVVNKPLQKSDFGTSETRVIDYDKHHTPPRGIDLFMGYGAPLTSPVSGRVWHSGVLHNKEGKRLGTHVYIETDLGHLIELSCLSEVNVPINYRVDPWTLVGKVGKDCGLGGVGVDVGAGEPHVHTHVVDPPFAPRYKQGHQKFTEKNGMTQYLTDPSSISSNGHLKDSVFAGDNSRMEKLVEEAQKRFYAIAEKHPQSHLAWFMRESNKDPLIRFFPKVLVMNKMYENGMLETNELIRDVDDYLRWHSNINIGLFSPRPNPSLANEYLKRKPPFDDSSVQAERDKVRAAWDRIKDTYTQKRYGQFVSELENFRKMSPIFGEISFKRNYGVGNVHLGNSAKALPYLLLAEGLFGYKFEPSDEKQLRWALYWTYRNIEFAYQRLGIWNKSKIYRNKHQDPMFNDVKGLKF